MVFSLRSPLPNSPKKDKPSIPISTATEKDVINGVPCDTEDDSKQEDEDEPQYESNDIQDPLANWISSRSVTSDRAACAATDKAGSRAAETLKAHEYKPPSLLVPQRKRLLGPQEDGEKRSSGVPWSTLGIEVFELISNL